MGNQEFQKLGLKDAQEDAAAMRERLVHRQLQWLVFWTCLFVAAGALVGMGV